MFKNLLVFLIIPGLLFSAEIQKVYKFGTPHVANGRVYMKDCRLARGAFAPKTVIKPVKLLLPYGHKAVSFDVQYGNPITLKGEHELQPFRPSGRISVGPPAGYYTKRSPEYLSNRFYPAAVRSQDFNIQYKNGHAIFITKLNPVQYNAMTGKLRYFENISVTVHTEATRGAPTYRCTPFIKSQLLSMVDNTEAVSGLKMTTKDADDYEYLIVASSSLANSYSPFVEFNKRRCLRAKVETIQNITSSTSGRDNADKLRNFIIKQYTDHNIVYVLLGHDATTVPLRGLRAQMYDYGTDFYDDKKIPADLYFSCLDGTWQKPGSSYYGEFGSEDIGWEVFASRFAVDNGNELNALMNKTIKYSEQPVNGQIKNNLIAGEYSWGPPQHPVECYTKYELVVLKDKIITKNGYTTWGFGDTWLNTTLFEKDGDWGSSDIIRRIRDRKITWINHGGHSNNTYTMHLNTSHLTNSNFTNNGIIANYFIAYAHGCYPGNFEYGDCFGEVWTTITNGAVAFIANSRYGLGDDGTVSPDGSDGSSPRFQRFFHDAIFRKKIHYLEMMNAYSKEANIDYIIEADTRKRPYFGQMKYVCYEVNALGDPALSIWTENPKQWSELPKPKVGAAAFEMETPPFTWVALLNSSDEIITTQLTGYDTASWDTTYIPGNGHCKIEDAVYTNYVKEHPGEKLKVRIKAHNYLPYTAEVDIPNTFITNNYDNAIGFTSRLNVSGKLLRISYALPEKELVNISLYNSKGVLVRTLVNENQGVGKHFLTFNSADFNSGVYYCKLTFNNRKHVNKLIITK